MQVQALTREAATSSPSTASAATTAAARRPLEGPFTIIRNTILHHGVSGLWLGQTGTLLRETGGSAAWFSAYELMSRMFLKMQAAEQEQKGGEARPLTKKDLHTWQLVVSGASAGASYNIALFPADCIKSTMQTRAEMEKHLPADQRRPPPRFWGVAKDIYSSRGIKGLYAGCGVTVLRSAPSSAMIFLIYEKLEAYFG